MDNNVKLPPKIGELIAGEVVRFFDNVTDENGNIVYKSLKRARLLKLMKRMVNDNQINTCTLSTGEVVPIIVERKYKGRGVYCYFNTADYPRDEILQAFAKINNITCTDQKIENKKEGELIAQDILHLMDDVKVNGKKVSGTKKRAEMIALFQKLYNDRKNNVCKLENGEEIPIIVKRKGVNNRVAYCLNSSIYKTEVLKALAKYIDCAYLEYKENEAMPKLKHERELTARACAKIFHKVRKCEAKVQKRENKENLVLWFKHIYENHNLNRVILPNGKEVEAVVMRLSGSQHCLCLNTSDASIKPFVIKRVADISEAEVCFDNLDLSKDDKKELCSAMKYLIRQADKTKDKASLSYYMAYADMAFRSANIKTKCKTPKEWVKHNPKDDNEI